MRYAGQQQTCGRCHEVPRNCTGGGIARKCDAEGGAKVEFSDHILALWKRIGYTPANSDIAVELEPERDEVVNSFTPVKVPTGDQDKYAGVSIRQFPKDTDQGLVMEFLCRSGLPEDKKDTAVFKSNGVVTINDLDNNTSKVLIEAIHGNFEFGRRLYCNGVIPLTPQKQAQPDGTLASSDPATSPTRPAATSSQVDANSEDTPAPIELTTSPTVAPPSSSQVPAITLPPNPKAPAFIAALEKFDQRIHSEEPSNNTVVRRHSFSTLLGDPKDPAEHLSDFGSCMSSSSDASSDDLSGEENIHSEGFKTMNEKKRIEKNKRKFKLTPGKENFLKKPNLVGSI